MKLGVLYSGGKDSTLALMKAREYHEIVCLITLVSRNKESFMFHTPNIDITSLQAEALGLPLVRVETEGEKEKELDDLRKAVAEAKQKYKIEGLVTGAVRSTYQATRIQTVCHELGLWCFNPLWLMDQKKLLYEIINSKIIAIISGVFAEPLDKNFLGKEINQEIIEKLCKIAEKYKINIAGEGGEIETTVIDAPVFQKQIKIENQELEYKNYSGVCRIKAKLVQK